MEEVRETDILLNGFRKQQKDEARYSSIDICPADEIAVCMADIGQTSRLKFKLGKYHQESNKLEWGESTEYVPGKFPAVALIKKGGNVYVIEFHNDNYPMRDSLSYRVGKIVEENRRIEWFGDNPYQIQNGKKVKICAVQDKIITVYEEHPIRHRLQYRIGELGERIIEWKDPVAIRDAKGVEPDISVSGKKVVLAYRVGYLKKEIMVLTGNYNAETSEINWLAPGTKCGNGINPTVSLNEKMNMVLFSQSAIGRKLWLRAGALKENEGSLQETQVVLDPRPPANISVGEYPTVLLLDNDFIIMMHKDNLGHDFYQTEGILKANGTPS